MIESFSDILIQTRGGATGRTNLLNQITVVFPGGGRLGELVTSGELDKTTDTMKLNSFLSWECRAKGILTR